MSIATALQKGASTAFKVLKSLSHPGTYTHITKDDGFTTSTSSTFSVDVIMDSFSERDVQFLSFSNLIQPQDVRGLVLGSQVSVEPTTKDKIAITDSSIFSGGSWSIIAWDVDTVKAMFTFLLRRT